MELNLRLILLMIAGLFVFGIIFESLRRKKQRKEALTPDFRNANPYKRNAAKSSSGDLKEPSVGDWHDDIIGSARVVDASTAKVPQNKPIVKAFENLITKKHDFKKAASKPRPENYTNTDDDLPYVTSATSNDLIVFYIMAPQDRVFGGYELLQTLESVDLQFGPLGIFHYYDESQGSKDLLFCLASAFEPGVFDIDKMGSFSCLGLCVFMSLNHKDPMKVFNIMVEKVHQLSEDLNGIVCDSQRNPCSQDFLEACKNQIVAITAKKADKTATVM